MTQALADEDKTPIRIGITVPEGQDSARLQHSRLDAFAEALAASVGFEVTGKVYANYREILDAMHAGAVDVAWLPPVIALRAAARGRTLPIALPVRGGTSFFSSALFTRPGSPLKSPADLHRVSAAWVDQQSAAGYLVVRASLRAQGVDLGRAFATESFLGSHDAVVQAVLSGAVDVGATFAHLDAAHQRVTRGGWGTATPQVIAYAGPIPADVVAASIRMAAPQIRAVQRALCGGESPELLRTASMLLGAEGFVPARSEHLDPLNHLLGYLEDVRHDSSIPPPARPGSSVKIE
jgi:phosphate/phosphite/phosphonate ABC transporter binding protein